MNKVTMNDLPSEILIRWREHFVLLAATCRAWAALVYDQGWLLNTRDEWSDELIGRHVRARHTLTCNVLLAYLPPARCEQLYSMLLDPACLDYLLRIEYLFNLTTLSHMRYEDWHMIPLRRIRFVMLDDVALACRCEVALCRFAVEQHSNGYQFSPEERAALTALAVDHYPALVAQLAGEQPGPEPLAAMPTFEEMLPVE